MKLRSQALALALIASVFTGTQAAFADIIRIVENVAANQADYEAGLKELATASGMIKKTPGNKDAYSIYDPKTLMYGTVSVWGSEEQLKVLSDSPEWKAVLDRIKYQSRTVKLFQIKD